MRAFYRNRRAQNGDAIFTLTSCSKVPDTDGPVPSSSAQQFFVVWIPSDTFDGAHVTSQRMGDRVSGGTGYACRLVARAGSQARVISVPFNIKDAIVMRLQNCSGWLLGRSFVSWHGSDCGFHIPKSQSFLFEVFIM